MIYLTNARFCSYSEGDKPFEERKAGVKVPKTLIVILATAGFTQPIPGSAQCVCSAKPRNADLEMAKIYAGLSDWKDAETHFAVAAKDPAYQKEALAGLEKARWNVDAAQAAVLEAGGLYESEHMWSKAEDLYRVAAIDSSMRDETRSAIAVRLAAVLKAQRWEREFDSWKKGVETAFEAVVFAIGVILLFATIHSIWRRRRAIHIYPFAAPSEELANGVAVNLKYARAMMQNPALSPAGSMPAPLVANLMTFNDEVDPIEDLEIAGSKIPFSSLANLFGRPAIQVSGGFDGVAPLGYAYSIVKTHNASADSFHQQSIRVGAPNQQRRDLLDFAYDVLVRATSAYANV
jgi:hypothetical protein